MANQPKKYKKFVATAATATLVASAIVPVASAAGLSDIAGNTHEKAINALVDAKVISGYPDGTFKPNKELTRSDVVKLLGKYLETQGFEIPADAVSNPRFADLNSKSNEELLKYAAVVADAGVFSGSNGKLLAGDPITRENMAIVLVRMVNTLNDVNLEAYVASQDFAREVKDINAAKAEARSAIDVLDFYDITTVANFLPKNTVTRGQFATFLNNVINADFTGAEATTGAIKVINNTTVEVTLDETIGNIEDYKFTIAGLDVKNVVKKQASDKTVVLTTAAQEGGKEYVVSLNGKEIGKFTGVSAVLPTKVELVSSSVQGKLGQQVAVQAKVTVADGQSKAGIPVTFSVPNQNNDGVYPTVTGEAVTNEEGIATFTYTRYGHVNDTVTAYATGDRSKFAIGYVFWGVDTILAITEVTEGATINNGANKTYKITYKHPETGLPVSNQTFNVGFLENMNVTSDKVANATVNGVKALQLSNGTSLSAAQITTDSKGEATFTVSGVNAAVTPVVYALNNATGESNQKYKASALQASTAKVTFGAVQAEYKIELTREGGEVAARYAANGREYKIVVKDKDGKVAKNEIVNVAFNEDLDRVISTNTQAKFVDADNDAYYPTTPVNGMSSKQISVKTNDKGEATFVISSDLVNDYATPIAWIDINTSDAKQGSLDEGEPKAIAPISYFQDAYLDGSAIKAYKSTDTTFSKAVTKFDGTDVAVFAAELVNQSGKKIAGIPVKKVTYTIFNTGANDIKIGDEIVSPNRSLTVTYEATISSTGTVVTPAKNLEVVSVDGKTTSVKVIATGVAVNTDGKDYAFTAKDAEATFTSTTEVPNNYTGVIAAINTSKQELTFAGKKAVSVKDAKFFGQNGAELANFDAFVNELKVAAAANQGVVATYLKDSEGKVTVKIVRTSGDDPVKFDEKSSTLTAAAITKQPVAGTASTAATATVTYSTINTVGNEIKVNDTTYKFATVAGPTETAYYQNAADLAAKINAANGDVTATVNPAGDVVLTGKANGTAFVYAVNGAADTTVNNGVVGVEGNEQQLTLTFSSALNVAVGDVVTVNGTTATVKSFNTAKTSVVIELDAGQPVFVSGTVVTTITLGTNNAIKNPADATTVTITNNF
ncbi:S-layer homology domain-containing protein [Bacillus ndiopicus]|uniref:S-layer homology domain-containing protein n=1 Tax=Bacillus ndiopicus TaxID=1347368 RepID=UPI0006949D7D|nr:S-layer homology domain-containing protein [Bacillus ndiopicus]